jgi:hypothetical protein
MEYNLDMQPDLQNPQATPLKPLLDTNPESIDPIQQTSIPPNMPKQTKIIITILVVILLISGIVTLIFINTDNKTIDKQHQTQPSKTSFITNTPTVRAKKSLIECKIPGGGKIEWEVNPAFDPTEKFFSSTEVEYPKEWPEDLKYPSLFMPIEARAGKTSEESKPGYVGNFIFEGTKEDVINELEYFFDTELWTITCEQVSKRDYVILLSAPNNERSGIINIQETSTDPKRTAVFSLLFPDNKN